MKYFDKAQRKERYFDKTGNELFEGDYIRLSEGDKPQRLYEYVDEAGDKGLGIDATNPIWIEKGRAKPCQFGIYPLTYEDTESCELCGKD